MTATRAPVPVRRAGAAEIVTFRVTMPQADDHLFHVELTVARPQARLDVHLPVWIPGSYLVREFSRHLQALRCTQAGRDVPVQQCGKAHWQISCTPEEPVVLHYVVYAYDASVRAAWLDTQRGFFNGTSLLLQVPDKERLPHQLEILPPVGIAGWSLATGLTPLRVKRNGFGIYRAEDYSSLVDAPMEMGRFWSGTFSACGVAHRMVVTGAANSFDGERLLTDAQAICEQQIRFWHGVRNGAAIAAPFDSYVFLLNTMHDGYGGLEHRNSTALICPRKDLPRATGNGPTADKKSEGYTTLLGLISHEYFHSWNVKRLRPAEFTTYDYSQENYTELLWFFEGFTSYYDDLLLLRAGRIDEATYLKLLTKTINQVLQTPGRQRQTVAQASFDAWIKYYRQDENTVNVTVSYYTKGALVALCLDLTLRGEGKGSLDSVMRGLWLRCQGGPMTQADLLAVLENVSGRSFAREITRWVHSTHDLPLQPLLERHGIQVNLEPDQTAQQLGLRVKESGGAVTIQQVLQGGPAAQAGFAAGDEWLAVQAVSRSATGPWKIQSLDDIALYCGDAKKLLATVVRDRRLLQLHLKIPKPGNTVRLSIKDHAQSRHWLTDSTAA